MKISHAVARKHKIIVKPKTFLQYGGLPSWLEDNAFHNPNDELLLFSGITGRVRNTPQDQETLPYSMLFLTDKIIEDIVLEPNRYQN